MKRSKYVIILYFIFGLVNFWNFQSAQADLITNHFVPGSSFVDQANTLLLEIGNLSAYSLEDLANLSKKIILLQQELKLNNDLDPSIQESSLNNLTFLNRVVIETYQDRPITFRSSLLAAEPVLSKAVSDTPSNVDTGQSRLIIIRWLIDLMGITSVLPMLGDLLDKLFSYDRPEFEEIHTYKIKLEAIRGALFTVLTARSVSLSADNKDKIEKCNNKEVLTEWLFRAATSSSAFDIFTTNEILGYLAQGKLEGKRDALFKILAARNISLSDAERAQILQCKEEPTLDKWLDRAATASSAATVFVISPISGSAGTSFRKVYSSGLE